MSDEQNQNQSNQEPDKTVPIPVVPVESNPNQIVEENSTPKPKNGDSCDNPVFIKECKPKGMSTAEKIAALAVTFNFIAILFTCNMAKVANSTFDLAKQRDSTTVRQIQDLNRPYLQISYDSFRVAAVGQRMVIVFSFRNLGQYTAKITEGRFGIVCDSITIVNPFDSTAKVPVKSKKISNINTYIVKEFKEAQEFESDDTLTYQNAMDVINGKKFIFFYGEVSYINELTHEPYFYRFNIKYIGKFLRNYSLLYNENVKNEEILN